ncbi:MAG TPA: hypothetical protein VF698_18135 [Thermoanaerobaculia bacterium]
MRCRGFLPLLLCLIATSAAAQSSFERVLVPVIVSEFDGAHGSHWATEFWGRIEGPKPAQLPPLNDPDTVMPVGEDFEIPGGVPRNGVPALFIEVPTGDYRVSLNLRVRDTSRAATDNGTEIPLPREADFTAAPIQLLNVSSDPRHRIMLRVYESIAEGMAAGRVRVTVFARGSSLPLETRQLSLEACVLRKVCPGYAELPITSHAAEALRVVVEPLEPQRRLWAFITVTNNETQHVTTVTPRP